MLFDSNVMLSIGSENYTCLSQCGLIKFLWSVPLKYIYMHDHSDS